MKKLYILLLFIATTAFTVNSQTFFTEDFSSGVPPTGWSIDTLAGNWSANPSNNAGGTAPEARFAWDPPFVSDSRLISLPVDLTGYTAVTFSFKHMIDHYGGDYSVGVATRSGGGVWSSVWELVNPSGVAAEEVEISISNGDVGQPDFEICFYFSGNSYNINYWYMDDAKLFIPLDHDVATKKIFGDTYFDQGDDYTASALVKNSGLNTETFDVVLEIMDVTTDDILFTDTQAVNSLEAGTTATVNFATYVLPYENYVYNVVITTDLDGDMDTSNNMKNKYIYTYTSERGMVVIEIATGTWCGYCPGAAMGADDLIANGKDCAIIEYHGGDDYETVDSDARIDYYGITGYPTAVFDGLAQFVGGSATQSMYANYLPLYEARKEIRSAFSTDIYGGIVTDEDYTVLVSIDKLAPAMNEHVVLHVGLTESEIPENWQGQDHLNFVNRLMIPDASGTVVDVVNNSFIEVEHTFTIDPSWDVMHCELVYFLQDTDTKEILQGGKVMVNDLIPVGIDETIEENGIVVHNIYPNPFSNETNINFSIANTGNVLITVHDMTGREVAVLSNEEMMAGEHQISWEAGSEVPNGIYFCTISTADHKLTQKVMLSR